MANVPHDRPLATREESAAAGVTPCAYQTCPFGFWVGEMFFLLREKQLPSGRKGDGVGAFAARCGGRFLVDENQVARTLTVRGLARLFLARSLSPLSLSLARLVLPTEAAVFPFSLPVVEMAAPQEEL